MTILAPTTSRCPLPEPYRALGLHPQFVNWTLMQRPGQPKPAKVPVDAASGGPIDPHKPENWLTAQEAIRRTTEHRCGVGFVLTADDPFVFVDIDHCRDEAGNWSSLAMEAATAFQGAMVEISQSGSGLHIIGTGTVPEGFGNRDLTLGLEVYTDKRFAALNLVGGQAVGDANHDCTAALATFVPAHLPNRQNESATGADWTTAPRPDWSGPTDDDELIRKMLANRSAASVFGGKASPEQLWRADSEALGAAFPDDGGSRAYDASSADMALASHLAFWTGCDCDRMARLMRRSALVRDKWDRHSSYLKGTILAAVKGCKSVYGGSGGQNAPAPLSAAPEGSIAFPDPVDPFGEFVTPPLPRGALPSAIEDFAFDQASLMGVDPGGIAISALVCCAAMLPDDVMVQVKKYDTGWKESTRLWGVLVGLPSAKKSPTIGAATAPVKQISQELSAQYQDAVAAHEALSDDEREGSPAPKEPRRLIANDTTMEALQGILSANPQGLLVVRDELAGWIGSMEKYSGNGAATDRAFWLEAWNGGPYHVDRIGRGNFAIPNLSVCLIGGIQPEALARTAKHMNHDGTLQRFLPVMLGTTTQGEDRAPNAAAHSRYKEVLRRLMNLQPLPNMPCRFDDEAQEIRKAFESYAADLTCLDDLGRHLPAWAGKLPGLYARACLTAHCIEAASGQAVPVMPPEEIPSDTVRKIDRLFRDYLIPHGLRFFCETVTGGKDTSHAKDVAGLILAKRMDRITRSFLTQNYRPAKSAEGWEHERWLDSLVGLGWLQPETPGNKPTAWLVNPRVHEKFAERAKWEIEDRSKRHAALKKAITQNQHCAA